MRKERLIPLSLMAISLGLVASIGMSVAWYANGAYLRISDIDVSLMSEPELGIGLKASENAEDYYFGQFPYEELPKMKSGYSDSYDENKPSPINGFVPVSSMFSGDWIGKTDEKGETLDPEFCVNYRRASIYEENTFRKTDIAISGFYSVPLYLYCDRDMYATIAEDSTFVADHEANVQKAKDILSSSKNEKRSLEELTADLDNVINTLRFSIYDCESHEYWIIDPHKGSEETYLSGVLDLDENKLFDFYYDEKDETYKEYLFGEYDVNQIVYRENKSVDEPSRYDAFNANHSSLAKEVDVEYCKNNGILKREESYIPSEVSSVDMISLKNHKPHRIVLSIYIEGWDHDNIEDSAEGSFKASIKFKLTRPNYSN